MTQVLPVPSRADRQIVGVFRLYHLHDEEYLLVNRSEIPELRHLDLDLLSRCLLMAETSRLQAAQVFRQGIDSLKP